MEVDKNVQQENSLPQIEARIDRLMLNGKSSTKAIASATIANAFAVHGIQIIQITKGYFVSMPQNFSKKTEYNDVFHAITAEARIALVNSVMNAFNQAVAEVEPESSECTVEQFPISGLNLGARAMKVLQRNGFKTVGDILTSTDKYGFFYPDNLKSFRNAGAKTIQEIIESIDSLKSSGRARQKYLFEDIPLSELNLSARARNALRREEFVTVGDVLTKTVKGYAYPENLWAIRNAGEKTAQEIVQAINSVMRQYEVHEQGTGTTTFEPDAIVTREQMATFLYRYIGAKPFDSDLTGYTDASSVSDWAAQAVAYCTKNGIINGVGNNSLAPRDNAIRA